MMIYDVLNTVFSYAGYMLYSIPYTNYIISYDSYLQYITISYGKSNK